MATDGAITATEILGEVFEPIAPNFTPQLAQVLLQLRLSNDTQNKIRDLLARNNAGTLDATDRTALDNYLLVGQLIDLMQAKARLSLGNSSASA